MVNNGVVCRASILLPTCTDHYKDAGTAASKNAHFLKFCWRTQSDHRIICSSTPKPKRWRVWHKWCNAARCNVKLMLQCCNANRCNAKRSLQCQMANAEYQMPNTKCCIQGLHCQTAIHAARWQMPNAKWCMQVLLAIQPEGNCQSPNTIPGLLL